MSALCWMLEQGSKVAKATNVGFQAGYAPVDGPRMYYQIHGSADPSVPPLVLLHGGGDTIQTSFRFVLSELSLNRQVGAFEQQGYGHTADILDRPFTFEQSADDKATSIPPNPVRRSVRV
jgi:pimeloyl-ACP methyl ester carboxylesterase